MTIRLIAAIMAACRRWAAPALFLIVAAMPGFAAGQPEGSAGASTPQALAKELAPLSAEERAALLGRLTDAEARALLLHYLSENAPAAAATAASSPIERLRASGLAIRNNLGRVLAAAGEVPQSLATELEKLGEPYGKAGTLILVGFVLILAAVGGLAELLFRRLTRRLRDRVEAMDCGSVREQLGAGSSAFLLDLGALAAFAAGYAAIFLAVWEGNAQRRDLVIAVLVAILITRVAVAIAGFVFAPRHPDRRIMQLDDEAAAHFVHGTRRLAILGAVLFMACELARLWDVDHQVWRLMALVGGLLFTAGALVFLWRYRGHAMRTIETAVAGGVPRWAGGAAGWLWHLLAVGYVILAFLIGAAALLLDQPFDPVAAVLGFYILFVAYPYLSTLIAGLLVPAPTVEEGAALGPSPTMGERIAAAMQASDDDDDGAVHRAIAEAAAARVAAADVRALQGDRRVLSRIISLATFVATFALFTIVVGVDLVGGASAYPIASRIMWVVIDIGLVALVAYALWSFTTAWIDRKLAEEHAKAPPEEHEEAGPSMQGGTRLQTILPIIRKALAAAIAVISVMIVLDALGVNIAPLIAGAGVLGLAIGFGAQTLVKDLISGLFFLMDDAFRIGEYIEFGSAGGTVERFNPRSIVLRGYLGAVYTVPYGEIGTVTNYSRDWVIMKIAFRVPYDADLDKVRKIFKKIGQDMLEDPELGPNFLQPFKSQGVIKMDDSAFIVRGKFMTKPNKQWAVRKEVYERVQKAFREHGIPFAPKRVIVDVPHPGEPADRTRVATAEAAAAASVASEAGGR